MAVALKRYTYIKRLHKQHNTNGHRSSLIETSGTVHEPFTNSSTPYQNGGHVVNSLVPTPAALPSTNWPLEESEAEPQTGKRLELKRTKIPVSLSFMLSTLHLRLLVPCPPYKVVNPAQCRKLFECTFSGCEKSYTANHNLKCMSNDTAQVLLLTGDYFQPI